MNKEFAIKDCAIITQMGGVEAAMNLRELRDRILRCPSECLFHHFCETVIRPTFDDPEFRNDFAVWCARNLRDPIMAERLGIIDPYKFAHFDAIRQHMVDLIGERLSEVSSIQWVMKGEEFQFLHAVTSVISTGKKITTVRELIKAVAEMSRSSIYYHFIEARRRTKNGEDDFTEWMKFLPNPPEKLIEAFKSIDFYFLNLSELQERLASIAEQVGD